MAIDYLSLGKRIQAKRKERRKTQEKLAEAISVTVGYISQIERGITKVNLETLSKLAEVLECDVTDFLGGTAEKSASYLSDDLNSVYERLSPLNKKLLLEFSEVLIRNQC